MSDTGQRPKLARTQNTHDSRRVVPAKRKGADMGRNIIEGSADASHIRALDSEIETLKAEIAQAKPSGVEFLGEVIQGDILRELTGDGKLSASGAKTCGVGLHGDGGNLWLHVTPGGRSWLFRYRLNGRSREMGLGPLSYVSLANARARAVICRLLVRKGVDPIERRRMALPLDREEAPASARRGLPTSAHRS
jgi:hypothetical protein